MVKGFIAGAAEDVFLRDKFEISDLNYCRHGWILFDTEFYRASVWFYALRSL